MNTERGYIALIAMLVIGAICTATTLTMLVGGTEQQRATLITQQSAQAHGLADACADEALQRIRDDSSFVGTATVYVGPGTCTLTVTSTGVNTRTITASGAVSSVTQKVQVYVTLTLLSINITSWQETS